LLNQLWTSQIKSPSDVLSYLHISDIPDELDDWLKHINREYTSNYLFERFLQGTGIPSKLHFEDAQQHFTGYVDLSAIDKESFRPRVFCWALTGSPAVDFGSSGLRVRTELLLRTVVDLIASKVNFCDTDDVEYLPIGTDNGRQAMAAEGKIVFKTCVKQANIPITFLKRLVNQSYPTSGTKPFLSFEQAFDHWLLCELISSIGNHTIL